MVERGKPDPAARWISHAIVGMTVGYVIGKQTGPVGFWIAAIVSALAHEELDAPVAQALSQFGV